MRAQIFKQYDGPWSSLPFPGGGTNVKGSGCGLCSVTHILIEDDRYKDYTPTDVRPYMVKWAVRNKGLIHEGIPDTLRHYGMENVREFGSNASMNDIFTELNKGSRKGVILFYKCNSRGQTIASIGPDGTCWTGGGHFIAFTDYKVKDGKHWFYMKDSGSRNHDKWYSYENSMKSCVFKVWTCTIPQGEKSGKTSEKTESKETKVIDVSYVQNSIDWDKVKADGIDGAMIRCGYRGYGSGKLVEDSCFSKHVKGAVKAGLKVGVYFFTEAINAKEGKEEADYTLKLIKREGLKLLYPIAVDTESISASNVRANNISVSARTAAIQAFCEEIKLKGYEPMIYASTSWLENKLSMSKLPYKVWVAQYNSKVTYKGSYVMWQYTSTGRVSGISGVVDLNHCYISSSQKSSQTKTDTDEIKLLTVDGIFGTEAVKAAQRIFKTPIDGVISGQASSDMESCPGISSTCVSIGKGGSQLVRAIQRKVGAKEDGYLGKNTNKAIQKWLGLEADGVWGKATSKAFQTWLNKQLKPLIKPTKPATPAKPSTPAKVTYQIPTAAEIKAASVWAVRHDICEWHKTMHNSKKNNRYKSFTDNRLTQICPICNKITDPIGEGFNCIGEGAAGWHHGGRIPSTCNCEVINNQLGDRFLTMSKAEILAAVKSRFNIEDLTVLYNDGKSIAPSKLLPADLVIYYSGNTYKHLATWVGNGLIADCTSSANPAISYGIKSYSNMTIKLAIRYTGGRTYLSLGAKGAAVKKIQKIVGVTEDGSFGTATEAAVKKWQKAHKLTADGKVGPATLAEMKKVSA